MRVFRIILPVDDIDKAQSFYATLLAQPGRRVSPGRHYYDPGQMILALYDPVADGDADSDCRPATPMPEPVYFAVHDLEAFQDRAQAAGALFDADGTIADRPWGETSFYCRDPWGNKLCFVAAGTEFTG